MLLQLISIKTLTVAVAASGALLTGGVAAAATGTLPAGAQDTAKTVFGTVGITVPSGDADATDTTSATDPSPEATDPADGDTEGTGDTGSTEGTEASAGDGSDATGTDGAKSDDGTTHPDNHGGAVSHLATTTDATGAAKGAEISKLASNGKSHAGEQHPQGAANSSKHQTSTQPEPGDDSQSTDGTTAGDDQQPTAAPSIDGTGSHGHGSAHAHGH